MQNNRRDLNLRNRADNAHYLDFITPKYSVTDDAIPKALNVMWGYALNGSLYKLSCGLGMFAAAGVGFWSLKFYKALNWPLFNPCF
jgi:hypothetical protein